MAIKFAVSYAIPDIPEWVEDEIAKVEFKRREAEKAEKVCPKYKHRLFPYCYRLACRDVPDTTLPDLTG